MRPRSGGHTSTRSRAITANLARALDNAITPSALAGLSCWYAQRMHWPEVLRQVGGITRPRDGRRSA